MGAVELLAELRAEGAEVIGDDGYIKVTGILTDEQREAVRARKPELLKILSQESRRQKVLQIMAEEPTRPRAWYIDSESDPHYVILAFAKMIPALEEIYTAELTIKRADWDPFLFLELIDKEH